MIAVETVIRKLVTEYEFVIVPGFGALLSHQAQAFYNAETGIFSPPSKRLAFNEFLKLDDGLLANFISRHEQISHAEAVNYVRGYTDHLRASLHARGFAVIEGIGEFRSNVEGKLVFEPNTDKYFKDDWFGFKNVPVKVVDRKIAAIAPVMEMHDDHVELIEEETKTRRINWIGWTSAAMVAGILCYFSLFFVSSNGENMSTLNPFTSFFDNIRPNAEPVAEKKPVAPKRRVVYVVRKPVQPATDSLAVAEKPEVSPVAETKTAVVSEEVKTNEVAIDTKQFYLIAGAFKGEKKATVLMEEMKKKGFDNAVIIPADKYSKMVKVAVESYNNESDAYRASSRLKKVIGEEGWVYKKRQ